MCQMTLRERVTRPAGQRGATFVGRAQSSLPVRSLHRFASINGRDRTLVLGGQAFTTIVPLLIVVAAAASPKGPTAVADRLAERFRVTGTPAQAIRALFERPPGAVGSITVAGLVILGFSLLSLTRSLQRTHEAAWRLPAAGVRGTLNVLSALGLLISSVLVFSLLVGVLRHVSAGSTLAFVLRVAANTAISGCCCSGCCCPDGSRSADRSPVRSRSPSAAGFSASTRRSECPG